MPSADRISARSHGPRQGSELIVTLPLHAAAFEAPIAEEADGAQGAADRQAGSGAGQAPSDSA